MAWGDAAIDDWGITMVGSRMSGRESALPVPMTARRSRRPQRRRASRRSCATRPRSWRGSRPVFRMRLRIPSRRRGCSAPRADLRRHRRPRPRSNRRWTARGPYRPTPSLPATPRLSKRRGSSSPRAGRLPILPAPSLTRWKRWRKHRTRPPISPRGDRPGMDGTWPDPSLPRRRGEGPGRRNTRSSGNSAEGAWGSSTRPCTTGLNRLVALKMIRGGGQVPTTPARPVPDRGRGRRRAPPPQYLADLRHRRIRRLAVCGPRAARRGSLADRLAARPLPPSRRPNWWSRW